MRFHCSLIFLLALTALVFAGEENWSIHPAADKGLAKDFTPSFEKHFKLDAGVLRATCGLGETYYKSFDANNVFAGPGVVWASNATWPHDAENFEFVFDYKWFQEEPMTKFGDFPDMHAGFRLDKEGAGYDLSWGMLGQIRLTRVTSGASTLVAQGTLAGIKGKWARIKIRAAGPLLKVKVWDAAKPEPDTWSAEGFDDWSSAPDPRYKRGATALGFYARKLFDTCVYEFKDAKLTALSAADVSAEKFFDGKSAPTFVGFPPNSDTTAIKTAAPTTLLKDVQALTDVLKDKNLKVDTGSDGIAISSTDGAPAYFWKKVEPNFRMLSARVKAEAGARPLFAVKTKLASGAEELASMDPAWRDGIAALLWKDASHTVSAYHWTLKPDTWHDFVVENAHWQKWQMIDTTDDKNRAAFSARLIPAGTETYIGIGVAGKGSVTMQGLTAK